MKFFANILALMFLKEYTYFKIIKIKLSPKKTKKRTFRFSINEKLINNYKIIKRHVSFITIILLKNLEYFRAN